MSKLLSNIFNPDVEIIWLFWRPYWCYFHDEVDPDWNGESGIIHYISIPGYMKGYKATWIVGDRGYVKRRIQKWEKENRLHFN